MSKTKATLLDYIDELIDIIEHPENSNFEWKKTIIENIREKIATSKITVKDKIKINNKPRDLSGRVPIQVEVGEWWFKGCFIQDQSNYSVINKFFIFKDDSLSTSVGFCETFTEAKKLCRMNEVKNFSVGWENLIRVK